MRARSRRRSSTTATTTAKCRRWGIANSIGRRPTAEFACGSIQDRETLIWNKGHAC